MLDFVKFYFGNMKVLFWTVLSDFIYLAGQMETVLKPHYVGVTYVKRVVTILIISIVFGNELC